MQDSATQQNGEDPGEKLSGSFYTLLGEFQGQLGHLQQT